MFSSGSTRGQDDGVTMHDKGAAHYTGVYRKMEGGVNGNVRRAASPRRIRLSDNLTGEYRWPGADRRATRNA